jgi:hypothetical protein
MAGPARDNDGRVKPHDDKQNVPDDAYIIRYIPSDWLIPNEGGGRRLSSGAFSGSSKETDPYQGMSADLMQPMLDDGLSPTGRKEAHRAEAAVRLRVGALRTLGLRVGRDPGKTGDPYHVNVWDVQKRHRGKIRDIAEWIDKPDDVA